MKEGVEFVTSGVSEGKGTRWNYPLMAEIIERKVKDAISKNLDEAKKVAASTSKRACVKLRFKKKTVIEIAERGKNGKLPSYDGIVYRVRLAVRQLGFKARRNDDDLVVVLTANDLQRYINEMEE